MHFNLQPLSSVLVSLPRDLLIPIVLRISRRISAIRCQVPIPGYAIGPGMGAVHQVTNVVVLIQAKKLVVRAATDRSVKEFRTPWIGLDAAGIVQIIRYPEFLEIGVAHLEP